MSLEREVSRSKCGEESGEIGTGFEAGERHCQVSATYSQVCPVNKRGEGLAGLWDEDELEFGLAPVL